MLRDKLNDAMKEAMRARDQAALGTIRLILAKLKDVDIAARTEASREGVAEDKILSMMQGMIKQRNESIVLYEKGNRAEQQDRSAPHLAAEQHRQEADQQSAKAAASAPAEPAAAPAQIANIVSGIIIVEAHGASPPVKGSFHYDSYSSAGQLEGASHIIEPLQ